jgi:hypothetical protein
MFWATFVIWIEFGSAILEYVAENPLYMTEDVDDEENGETLSSGKSRRLSKLPSWLAARTSSMRSMRLLQTQTSDLSTVQEVYTSA